MLSVVKLTTNNRFHVLPDQTETSLPKLNKILRARGTANSINPIENFISRRINARTAKHLIRFIRNLYKNRDNRLFSGTEYLFLESKYLNTVDCNFFCFSVRLIINSQYFVQVCVEICMLRSMFERFHLFTKLNR